MLHKRASTSRKVKYFEIHNLPRQTEEKNAGENQVQYVGTTEKLQSYLIVS